MDVMLPPFYYLSTGLGPCVVSKYYTKQLSRKDAKSSVVEV